MAFSSVVSVNHPLDLIPLDFLEMDVISQKGRCKAGPFCYGMESSPPGVRTLPEGKETPVWAGATT